MLHFFELKYKIWVRTKKLGINGLNSILEHVTWKCSSKSQISLNVNMGVTWKTVAKRL